MLTAISLFGLKVTCDEPASKQAGCFKPVPAAATDPYSHKFAIGLEYGGCKGAHGVFSYQHSAERSGTNAEVLRCRVTRSRAQTLVQVCRQRWAEGRSPSCMVKRPGPLGRTTSASL